ncbi:MAG: transposase, partial [Nitrospinae bacterium]|nr:transposase [Nitrospinota bacterium]
YNILMRQTYFITSTVNKWIYLFHRPPLAEIILEALAHRISEGDINLRAYVIMPNHLHMILTLRDGLALSDLLRDFHKFTAKQVIETLGNWNAPLLEKFATNSRDRKRLIWRKTHSPKLVVSWDFFSQKLEYIHNNPVVKKWRLCERPELYPFSSAGDYLTGRSGPLPIVIVTPWAKA